MAKWKLMVQHYLTVPGTIWRYREESNVGEAVENEFPVPKLLDPNEARHCNVFGDCVVTNKKEEASNVPQKRCFYFEGPPTPDMEPLDDEAKKIHKEWEKKWKHAIESLPTTVGDQSSMHMRDEATRR